jgi:hypothetical protein
MPTAHPTNAIVIVVNANQCQSMSMPTAHPML